MQTVRERSTQLSQVFITSTSEGPSNCSQGLDFRDSSQEVHGSLASSHPRCPGARQEGNKPQGTCYSHKIPSYVTGAQRRGLCSKAVCKSQRVILPEGLSPHISVPSDPRPPVFNNKTHMTVCYLHYVLGGMEENRSGGLAV